MTPTFHRPATRDVLRRVSTISVLLVVTACGSTSSSGGNGDLVASDRFQRNVASGLGAADAGGPWTEDILTNAVSSVNGSEAVITFTDPRAIAYYKLETVNVAEQDIRLTFSTDLIIGSAMFLEIDGRLGADNAYYMVVHLNYPKPIAIELSRKVSGVQSVVAAVPSHETDAAEEPYRLRYQITGTDPTLMRAKIWRTGAPEPAEWLVSATDDAAALQGPGGFEFGVYSLDTPVDTRISWTFDDFELGATAAPR